MSKEQGSLGKEALAIGENRRRPEQGDWQRVETGTWRETSLWNSLEGSSLASVNRVARRLVALGIILLHRDQCRRGRSRPQPSLLCFCL